MDTHLALMRSIRADPLDESPRLQLADWLVEHGRDADQWGVAVLRGGRVPMTEVDGSVVKL